MEKQWYHIDATGKNLGRLAVKIAAILLGKEKPTFVPHQDTGDFVVVTNAEKIMVTGKKEEQKVYYRHTQYPGGLKETKLKDMRSKHPERIITLAVKGMLPHNKLRDKRLKKLKVYAGEVHPHKAQNPKTLEL